MLVLLLYSYSGRGKRSGLELGRVRANRAGVFDLHDGKVTSLINCWDGDRALADLGLSQRTE